MKYHVYGADRDSAEQVEIIVDADSEAAASEAANKRGLLVARVVPSLPVPATQIQPQYQMPEQGFYAHAPVINVATPRRGSSLGVASLILGIVALLVCWIPLVNLLGVPLAGVGLLLALIGFVVALTRGGASIGYPISGGLICGLALFVSLTITSAFVKGVESFSESFQAELDRQGATNQRVVGADQGALSSASDAEESTSGGSSPTAAAPAWADARNPVQQGDVQIQLTSVRVERVEVNGTISGRPSRSEQDHLIIEIELRNVGQNRKVDYSTWATALTFRGGTSLKDNFENAYRLVDFGFAQQPVGRTPAASIYPGDSASDVLVFERPLETIETLDLELPATHFGGTGMIRLRVPADMIEWNRDDSPSRARRPN